MRSALAGHLVEMSTVTSGTGSGTMGTANVTKCLAVTCTPVSYTVGGTVSGWTSRRDAARIAGLVLWNNGGDDLAVSGNGNFTFATSIAYHSTYAMVHTQPTGQTCTVTSGTGSGTVGTANVTSVAVTCTPTSYTVGYEWLDNSS